MLKGKKKEIFASSRMGQFGTHGNRLEKSRAIVMKGAAEKSPGEKTAWGILRGFREITLGSADVNICTLG